MEFNSIAKYYTFISRVVFGQELEIAKASLFENIPDDARLLLIGGGTGVSLQLLIKQKPHCTIDFVEASSEMIKLAKARIGVDYVNFYCSPIEKFDGDDYDVIITEFFLDLFSKAEIQEYIKLIKHKIAKNGVWIDTDFRSPNKLLYKALLKIMYLFFRVFSNVKADKLITTTRIIQSYNFIISAENKYKSGFLTSRLIVQQQVHSPLE